MEKSFQKWLRTEIATLAFSLIELSQNFQASNAVITGPLNKISVFSKANDVVSE